MQLLVGQTNTGAGEEDLSRLRFCFHSMKKSELLRAIQIEIQKHNLSTFMSEKHKIVQTGCSTCQKHFGTIEQYTRHITEDVLPPLLDNLSTETNEIQQTT
jgi:hypothetical protein